MIKNYFDPEDGATPEGTVPDEATPETPAEPAEPAEPVPQE